jgi:phenylpropionate dioxygenase-like ring-hydroxylating dioxygenase large terminal subunit
MRYPPRVSVSSLPVITSDPAPRDAWYVLARSRELTGKPRALTLFDTPIVLYRDGTGRASVLIDRCPHRNAPLSLGRVEHGTLECPYHGWRFDHGGRCVAMPGLGEGQSVPKFRVGAHQVIERDGWVWVYGRAGETPKSDPFNFPFIDDKRYTRIPATLVAEGSVRDVAENALDVPHTAFLHRGLFRTTKSRNDIEVVVRRSRHVVEAQYIGEPRPSGIIGRVLAPQGGEVIHFDRFMSPSIAQVEYRLGDHSHLVATTALTPLGATRTLIAAEVAFRLPAKIPGAALVPVIKPIAMQILGQDLRMLKIITEHVTHFGGPRYASTELDVLGPHIEALLAGDASHDESLVESVRLRMNV